MEFSRAADEAYAVVSGLTVSLNSDTGLYEPLERLYHIAHRANSPVDLSEEENAMLVSLKLDFERGGIALPAQERNRVADLQNRANLLGSEFTQNATNTAASIEVPLAKLAGMPSRLRNSLPRSPTDTSKVVLSTDNVAVTSLVMKHISDASVRRALYAAEHSRCAEVNLPVLDSLLLARLELAKALGFRGYNHLMFQGRLASTPEDVLDFLNRLSKAVAPRADSETQALLEEKRKVTGTSSEHVFAWDRSYLMGTLKSRVFELDAHELGAYFSLDGCVDGIAYTLRQVFGISMSKVPNSECADELWHSSVVKMQLQHEEDGLLGSIFLDLYPRQGKYGHAAHFCIKCGRDPGDGNAYQTPVVALVCNFASAAAVDDKILLSFSDYETLWHEFGHALHSLLSRTRFQHLSGTRVATDFVEVPSHLFEYFAWDERVLAETTRHFRTGEPLPTRHTRALASSRSYFIGSDLQSQILFSMLDLEYHGANPPIGSTTDVAASLQSRLTSVPAEESTSPQAAFQHFVGYGAGYYSCKLAAAHVGAATDATR